MQTIRPSRKSKRLVIRLSSLGDVILSTSVLEVASDSEVSFLLAREYSQMLEAHPKIAKIWAFERSTGLMGWIRLCRQIAESDYNEILDLHRSLRTRIAWLYLRLWSLVRLKKGPTWRTVSKQRFRLYGYFLMKRAWPKAWRPRPLVERFALLAGGTGSERPNLRHLLSQATLPAELEKKPYLCVMPGSRWPGKRWPVQHFEHLLRELGQYPVILGAKGDHESFELSERLTSAGVPHYMGAGSWDLAQIARVLASSTGYFGNDTGLAHLAEALGMPAVVLFGPTVPDMGFGPWRARSISLGSSLWCRPCGKDGRYCFRIRNRYACMETLRPEKALPLIAKRASP